MSIYVWHDSGPLCFTAGQANSTVQLTKIGTPTSVTLEKSSDKTNWSTYTIGDTITLSNIGDKVYFRNTSETTTGFNIDNNNQYKFSMTGSIAGSGDTTSLLNKNGTTTVSSKCFYRLFSKCSSLTIAPDLPATSLSSGCYSQMFSDCSNLVTAPSLPATSLANDCYYYMFGQCSNLGTLPALPATTLADYCYMQMFNGCSKIKISTSQTGDYQTPYRIPTTGTGTTATYALSDMFYGTGGTFTGTPSLNTTYYTSNTVV